MKLLPEFDSKFSTLRINSFPFQHSHLSATFQIKKREKKFQLQSALIFPFSLCFCDTKVRTQAGSLIFHGELAFSELLDYPAQ